MARKSSPRSRLAQIVRVVFDGNELAAAEAVGVPQSTLHRILAGKTADPRLSTLRRLAEGFNVELSWLTGEVDRFPEERSELRVARPLWWHLIARFSAGQVQSERAWLGRAEEPSEPTLCELLATARAHSKQWEHGLLAARVFAERGQIPSYAIPAFRAAHEAWAEDIKLAVRVLKEAGVRAGPDRVLAASETTPEA